MILIIVTGLRVASRFALIAQKRKSDATWQTPIVFAPYARRDPL